MSILSQDFEDSKWFVPILIYGRNEFLMEAVWAMNHRGNRVVNGIRPAYATLKKHQSYFRKNTLIIGDFSNNIIWDDGGEGSGSFSDIIRLLEGLGLKSCYHVFAQESYGEESQSTLCWRKSKDTMFHVDYCFAGGEFSAAFSSIPVGEVDDWLDLSDYVPLIVDFGMFGGSE